MLNFQNMLWVIVLTALCTAAVNEFPNDSSITGFHGIGLKVGMIQLKERNLAPVAHGGMLAGGSYEFRKIKRQLHTVAFSAGYARPKTGYEGSAVSMHLDVSLYYSNGFLLLRKNNWDLFAGPMIGCDYSLSIYPNWDESHLYWADIWYLGGHTTVSADLPRNRSVLLSLRLPIAALCSRPEQNRQVKIDDVSAAGILSSMHGNINPGLLNRIFVCSVQCEYLFPVFDTKREGIGYAFSYSSIAVPHGQPLQTLSHSITLRVLL